MSYGGFLKWEYLQIILFSMIADKTIHVWGIPHDYGNLDIPSKAGTSRAENSTISRRSSWIVRLKRELIETYRGNPTLNVRQ